jgi:S-formylglutathione hydrolase FrmB
MALIRLDHTPETTKANQALDIILPDPGSIIGVPVRDRKVLYLLHGLSDDGSAWQRYSTVETLARMYGLVVVMPSVGRSFYIDLPNSQQYFTYLMEELPRYLADVFNLQPSRENTLIAGLSMGGYGAFKAALLHPERFYAAASFSGFLSVKFMKSNPDDLRTKEFTTVFGDLNHLSGSEHDPAQWLADAVKRKITLPRLFMACGRQDELYPLNQLFLADCAALGVPVEFHEEDAGHEWLFWDAQLRRFLASVLA